MFPFRKSLPLAGKLKPRNSLNTHSLTRWCEWKMSPVAGWQVTRDALGLSHERGRGRLALNQTPVLPALKQVNLRRHCALGVDAQPASTARSSAGNGHEPLLVRGPAWMQFSRLSGSAQG